MIRYRPEHLINKILPDSALEKMITGDLSLKKGALKSLSKLKFLDEKSVRESANKVLKSYKKRAKDEDSDDTKESLKEDPKLFVQRVKQNIAYQMTQAVKERYQGEAYTWIPSSADEPDPEHQLNYGKKFIVGVGEMPQDRQGCQCGMDIHTDDKVLDLE